MVVSKSEIEAGLLIFFGLDRLMIDRIEQTNDGTFDVDGVRNANITMHQASDRLRDHRLSVARRAVHEHRMTGVDGRAHLVQHALADHEVRERVANTLARGIT